MLCLCDRSEEKKRIILCGYQMFFHLFVDSNLDLGLDLYMIVPLLSIQYNLKAISYLIENQFSTALVGDNQLGPDSG